MKKRKKTILIVDDMETNIDILLELLGEKYDVVVSINGADALTAAKQNDLDLVLLDIMMPDMDGFEVCARLKADKDTFAVPVIFVTAKSDEESIERAYEAGGIDYVTKPFKPRELIARVDTQLKLKELIEYLEYISSYDQMTGIYNRRKFFELGMEKFEKEKEKLYAVMIDIDNFKAINDTYGHSVGDDVISAAAHCIKDNLSSEAIFGRLGGEEFAILCSYISDEEVLHRITKIREDIEKLRIPTRGSKDVSFTISEGVAKAALHTKNLDELLREADKAMYEAKDGGRNRAVFR